MSYQKKFWKGQIETAKGREDHIRGNPEAKPMHGGPGDLDSDIPDGADEPNKGTSQPKAKAHSSGEIPLPSKGKKKHPIHSALRAHALRMADDGTSTAAIGGGSGSAAGGGT